MSIFGTPQVQFHAGTGSAPAVNTANGDLLVVAVAGTSATTGFTLSDTAGNTFLPVGSILVIAGLENMQLFYVIGAKPSASNVIAPTATSGTVRGIAVWDFPITGGSPPTFDTQAQGQGTSTNMATSSFNTSGSDELVVCACINSGGFAATAQGGFTNDINGLPNNWVAVGGGSGEHGLLTSPQSGFVARMTVGSSTGFGAVAAAFAGPSSAGTQPSVVVLM